MLGSSWMTSVLGYLIIIVTVAGQLLKDGGLPQDPVGWVGFAGGLLTGVALRMAKDANKSNADHPKADAETVKPIA